MENDMKDNQIIIYQTEDGQTKIDVTVEKETVWLTQAQMAELFQRDRSVITKHINNIFEEGELDKNSVCAKFALTATDGKTYNTDCYSLDVIISVGYRVKSLRGTQFRIWANKVLKEYMIKGFAMNDDLLKDPTSNYFDELLKRVRDIRSSEKMFYRKVLDIYALSIDYNPKSDESKTFFATVQNKMHFAASGKTAAELIYERADSKKDFMGLTSWKGYMPQKNDALVAKNYLTEDELDTLNRIVSMYLDFAELQAKARKPMYMKDWIAKLDAFLNISERDILTHAGKISSEFAQTKASEEYSRFYTRSINEMSEVEKHFIESVERTEKLLTSKKKAVKKMIDAVDSCKIHNDSQNK
jgi:hypothetical protein